MKSTVAEAALYRPRRMAISTPQQKLDSGWYWKVPAARDLVHEALTPEAAREAEAQLGVRLPAAYLTLLRSQNGGALRASWPASYAAALWGIGPRAPSITHEQARWGPRARSPGAWAPRDAALLIPFDGGDEWDMCFDYRRRGPQAEPSITLIDSECGEEEPIAVSFAAYLAGLVDGLASCFRITSNVMPEALARALARQLGAPAPHVDPGHRSGIMCWRVALRGDHQWCWVSPNSVPASFQRGADGRALVSETTSLQLPEDPACTALVSCTAESRAAVEAALSAITQP
jgi:SMI1 / KNR4 family (SUKH-1)